MTTIEQLVEFKLTLSIETSNYGCIYATNYHKDKGKCGGHLVGMQIYSTFIICKEHFQKHWNDQKLVIKELTEKDIFTLQIL